MQTDGHALILNCRGETVEATFEGRRLTLEPHSIARIALASLAPISR